MTVNATADFSANPKWSSVWITTYSFDVAFFDQFLFRRLGEPPLNVNILADFHQLCSTWDKLQKESWRLRRVNSDYLLRGVQFGSGRFHPKTYFFGRKDRGVLLVGSGNLGLRGLSEGREVFCRFDSRHENDLMVFRSWHSWMSRLVVHLDDHLTALRWGQLASEAPWLQGSSQPSPFVMNLHRGLSEQFSEVAGEQFDELHVMAPFFDPGAHALDALLRRTRPREIHLYIAPRMSIPGDLVRSVIERHVVPATLHGFEPAGFLHAKLIGAIRGEDGVLLSGSANCSLSALERRIETGNVEAGILARLSSVDVRAAFVPANAVLLELPLSELADLTYQDDPEATAFWPVRLRSASLKGGVVTVMTSGADVPTDSHLATPSGQTYALENNRTLDAFADRDTDHLVWIEDGSGVRVSNAVPIDDLDRLASWLGERQSGGDHPTGLEGSDLETPLGILIQWLHEECIFDVDESPAFRASRGSLEGEILETAHDGFWERIQQHELLVDPRATRYARLMRLTSGDPAWRGEDEVFRVLHLMLHRLPGELGTSYIAISPDGAVNSTGKGVPWTLDRRVQVRFGNVLQRWISGLNDRRLRWLSPQAAARNYVALLYTLAECWANDYLNPDRLKTLGLELLRAFVGSQKEPGYFLSLDPEDRDNAIQVLGPEAPQLAAALLFAMLRPQGDWRAIVYEWQPALKEAIEQGVVYAGPLASEWLAALASEETRSSVVATEEIDGHLLRLAMHIDDRQWGFQQAEDLGLSRVELVQNQSDNAKKYPFLLRVRGASSLRDDARLVALSYRLANYKRAPGLIIELEDDEQERPSRLSMLIPGPVFASEGGRDFRSAQDVTRDKLAEMATGGAAIDWVPD